jgi:uncharacterized membrane protein YedE/YeeE
VFAIIGGVLIALATSVNLLLKGRITGMSGIFWSLIHLDKASFLFKTSTVSGMIFISSLLYILFDYTKPLMGSTYIFSKPEESVFGKGNLGNLSLIGFALAGLCVGFGTKLSNGCTSGHGVIFSSNI